MVSPSEVAWTTEIDLCDVKDKKKLKQFRDHQLKWATWLHDSRSSSIFTQYCRMMHNDLFFRSINYSLSSRNPAAKLSIDSPEISDIIQYGYISTQSLTIRRLTEIRENSRQREIISLSQLVLDIEKHKNFLTREVYVSGNGHPYDGQSAHNAALAAAVFEPTAHDGVFNVAFDLKAVRSIEAHKEFDFLSRTKPEDRTRNDLINGSIFRLLRRKLNTEEVKTAKYIADKIFAHAAHPRNADWNKAKPTLDMFEACHKSITEALNCVDSIVFGTCGGATLPEPMYDFFNNISRPFITERMEAACREYYEKRRDETARWVKL